MNALLGLGAGGNDEPAVFRRTRRDVVVGPARRTCMLAVRLSPPEREMHRLLNRYTTLVWQAAGRRGDTGGRLLSVVLRKRALSGAGSLLVSLDRRIRLLQSGPDSEGQLPLPIGDEDPLDDALDDDVIGARGLDDAAGERRLLQRLREVAAIAGRDETKVRVLGRLLARVGESAIVFTEYRDTLMQLFTALARYAPLQVHGALPLAERESVLSQFTASGGVLLATDAASEGLNLQHTCRLVVHFELPWNPMRLEQRVGRVDRLGQRRRVHEIVLVARHTAERFVLAPLVRRMRLAHDPRVRRLAETEVAATIVGGEELPCTPSDDSPRGAFECRREADAEARRLLRLRRSNRPDFTSILVPVRAGAEGTVASFTFVVRAVAEADGGPRLATIVHPVRIDLSHAVLVTPASRLVGLSRELIAGVQGSIATALHGWYRRHGVPWAGWAAVLSALVERERSIGVGVSPPGELIQRGLFDRRAELAHEDLARSIGSVQAEVAARLQRLASQSSVHVRVEMVAIHAGGRVIP